MSRAPDQEHSDALRAEIDHLKELRRTFTQREMIEVFGIAERQRFGDLISAAAEGRSRRDERWSWS